METVIHALVGDEALRKASALVLSEGHGDVPSGWPVSLDFHSDETTIHIDSENPPLLVETLRRLADSIEQGTKTGTRS